MNPPAPVTSTLRPCQRCEPADIAGIYSHCPDRSRPDRYNPARGALGRPRQPQRRRLPAAHARGARANTATETSSASSSTRARADGSWKGVERSGHGAGAPLRGEHRLLRRLQPRRRGGAGRLLAFVNFDGQVEPGWDAPLSALLDDPTVVGRDRAAALPRRRDDPGRRPRDRAEHGDVRPARGHAARRRAPDGPIDVAAATGALMMVRRDEFLALGGFYEPIFMYGEEADYCLRVPGRIVLHPGSAIRHEHGHASGPHRSPTRLYWAPATA